MGANQRCHPAIRRHVGVTDHISVVDQGDRFEDRQRIWEAIYPETGMGKAPKNNADRKNEIISFSNHATEDKDDLPLKPLTL